MEPTPSLLAAKASWLITQTAVHARRMVSEGFAAAGARGHHYRVLATLQEFGPASQADLGRHCLMDRSDVVAAVTQLQRQGLIRRTADPADRRRNIVTITEAGQERFHLLERALEAVQDELLATLSATERQTLVDLLGKILAHHGQSPTP